MNILTLTYSKTKHNRKKHTLLKNVLQNKFPISKHERFSLQIILKQSTNKTSIWWICKVLFKVQKMKIQTKVWIWRPDFRNVWNSLTSSNTFRTKRLTTLQKQIIIFLIQKDKRLYFWLKKTKEFHCKYTLNNNNNNNNNESNTKATCPMKPDNQVALSLLYILRAVEQDPRLIKHLRN